MKTINQLDVKEKKVILRTDYDVPLKNGKILDDTRIQASLPTIKYLLKNKASYISILCHLDRPGGKVIDSLKVVPIAKYLNDIFPSEARIEVKENLRFHEGEEKNNLEFAEKLSLEGDIYINDAFAVSHRKHASIVSLPKFLPSAIGLHFQKELKALDKVLNKPRLPFIVILGGAKLETKLPLIKKLEKKANKILIGGKLVQEIKNTHFSVDLACVTAAELTASGKDINQKSINKFKEIISKAGTIVWNGPLGIYEEEDSSFATREIANAINSSTAYTVIGGGDTEAAATKFAAETNINHISTGGGAMLQYLADGTLPGLEAIKGGSQ